MSPVLQPMALPGGPATASYELADYKHVINP